MIPFESSIKNTLQVFFQNRAVNCVNNTLRIVLPWLILHTKINDWLKNLPGKFNLHNCLFMVTKYSEIFQVYFRWAVFWSSFVKLSANNPGLATPLHTLHQSTAKGLYTILEQAVLVVPSGWGMSVGFTSNFVGRFLCATHPVQKQSLLIQFCKGSLLQMQH